MKKIFLIIIFVLLSVNPVLAFDFKTDSGVTTAGDGAGYGEANLSDTTITEIIGTVIKTVLLWLGIFFFVLCIYAGFTWMLSSGNSQRVDNAKSTLQNAIIGLIIIVASYAVTYFIMDVLLN